MPDNSPQLHRTLLYSLCQIICHVVTTVMFDLKVTGKHHVPPTGGVLLLPNHQSYLDPVLVGVQLRRPLSFLAKSQLFENPALSWLIRSLNAFPVRLGAGDVGALRETISRLKEGHIMTVFPEGTRTLTGEMGEIQPGFALIVRKTEAPIIPVAIDGSFDAWRPGTAIFKPHRIRVKYGQPLDVSGLKAAEIVLLVDQKLRELMAEIHAEDNSNHSPDGA
jgi:1-acyl-sn-glycerol-3-phosphate acyltransferase